MGNQRPILTILPVGVMASRTDLRIAIRGASSQLCQDLLHEIEIAAGRYRAEEVAADGFRYESNT